MDNKEYYLKLLQRSEQIEMTEGLSPMAWDDVVWHIHYLTDDFHMSLEELKVLFPHLIYEY